MIFFHATQYLAIQYIIVGKFCPDNALNTRERKVFLAFHLHYDDFFVGKTACYVLDAFNWYKPMNFRELSFADCHLDVCVPIQVLLLKFVEDKHNGFTLSLVRPDFNKPLIAFRSHLCFYLKHHTFPPFR